MSKLSPGPTLTVIVPLYNGGQFVGETLDSLAAQTVPVHEVIVVDDGSTDDGVTLARDHPVEARVLTQPNAGVAVARNRGAFAARSQFIAFLDQDDLWLTHRHERIREFLATNDSCRALATNERSFFLAADRETLGQLGEGLHERADHPDVVSVAALLAGFSAPDVPPRVIARLSTRDLMRGTITVTTSYVVERETFFAIGGCAPIARSMDDYWMLLNLSRLTPIVMLDEPSVLYRIHPTSTTMTTTWPLPLLTSLIAARHGGSLIPTGHARDGRLVDPLGPFWQHQLFALARSGTQGLTDAIALTHLISSRRERSPLIFRLIKTAVRERLRGGRVLRATTTSPPER